MAGVAEHPGVAARRPGVAAGVTGLVRPARRRHRRRHLLAARTEPLSVSGRSAVPQFLSADAGRATGPPARAADAIPEPTAGPGSDHHGARRGDGRVVRADRADRAGRGPEHAADGVLARLSGRGRDLDRRRRFASAAGGGGRHPASPVVGYGRPVPVRDRRRDVRIRDAAWGFRKQRRVERHLRGRSRAVRPGRPLPRPGGGGCIRAREASTGQLDAVRRGGCRLCRAPGLRGVGHARHCGHRHRGHGAGGSRVRSPANRPARAGRRAE